MHERDNEEIVRINGESVICVQIFSSYLGNDMYISKQVKQILKNSELSTADYKIMQDNGQYTYELIKNVIIALIESFICVLIIVPLFYSSYKVTLILLIIIPINILWTLAELNISNFIIDQNILSGLTISIGLISDSTLVIAEISEKNYDILCFQNRIKKIIPSIVSSSFTTILAIIPLIFMDSIVPGIKTIGIAIILMLINSTIISILFIPTFIYSSTQNKHKLSNKINSILNTFSLRILLFTQKNYKIYKFLYIIILIIPIYFLFSLGKNISLQDNTNVIYASIEYEPEKEMKFIDDEVKTIIPLINEFKGVTYVYTESRKGTCELEIGYNEKLISRYDLVSKVSEFGKLLSEGYLYIPEAGQKNSKNYHQIEICVIGDDTNKCKEYIKQIISISQTNPYVKQSVLNFKDAEKEIVIKPDAEIIAKSGTTVESIGSQLRLFLFGPVVDKWLQKDREIDIRIIGNNATNNNLSDLEEMHITLPKGHTNIKSLGEIKIQNGTGKIYRINNRRCAYGTISLTANSSEHAIKITRNIISKIEFEKGYGYQLSRELENMKKEYNTLFIVFLLCIGGILILLTALTENFTKALKIISIIPVSITFPLLIKYILNVPLELGDVVAMILISGISVNNSIYIMESSKQRIIFKVKDKVKSIVVTSLTTILGALPLVIMNTGSFAYNLSCFMLLGVVGSLISSIVLFHCFVK